jgi:hypothetical protein
VELVAEPAPSPLSLSNPPFAKHGSSVTDSHPWACRPLRARKGYCLLKWDEAPLEERLQNSTARLYVPFTIFQLLVLVPPFALGHLLVTP